MWDKSRPTRRPTTSASLISLISLRTVLCARLVLYWQWKKCFKHSASSCLAYLGSNFATLPHLSPTPYRLFVPLLHSTPLFFLPYLFLTYFLSYLLRGLSPAYPLPSLSSSILKTTIYFYFPFGTMSVPTERTSYSISFLFWPAHFMVFGFLFFLFLTPQTSTLSAFLYILYLPFHLSLYIFPTSHLNVSSP